jgi:hypothetical protein
MIYFLLYFISMNKHQQYSYYIGTFGLPKGERTRIDARVITIKRATYGVTVHLFIGMGHSPDKSTFMWRNRPNYSSLSAHVLP